MVWNFKLSKLLSVYQLINKPANLLISVSEIVDDITTGCVFAVQFIKVLFFETV